MMRFASLAARANRRFAWHWQPITVAGQRIEIATPTDPNELLVQACQRQSASTTGEDETTLAESLLGASLAFNRWVGCLSGDP